jgi:hypothetical protein
MLTMMAHRMRSGMSYIGRAFDTETGPLLHGGSVNSVSCML